MFARVAFIIVGVSLLYFTGQRSPDFKSPPTQMLVPPSQTKFFTFGYHEVVADTIWLRAIQDFDTCGRELSAEATPINQDAVSNAVAQRVGRCELSWAYRMIDTVTDLAPRFRAPYATGAVVLSVAVDDVEGAARIYEKAMINYPNDWSIAYTAAYHYLYEVGDRRRAAELLIEAGKNGAPYWVPVLAARLYSKTGSALLGKQVMTDFLNANPEQAENPHIKRRLAEINKALAEGDDAPAPAASQPNKPKTKH